MGNVMKSDKLQMTAIECIRPQGHDTTWNSLTYNVQ